MNIAIVGTGYVGLVSGTCFADMGANVTCVDVDAQKIERLMQGEIPIFEPGLDELVKKNVSAGRLKFTTDLASVLDDVEVVFSAVGTPPDEDGSADLKYVLQVARTIGQNMNNYLVVVTKSTVPVGTAAKVRKTIEEELDKRGMKGFEFDVASNPERWEHHEPERPHPRAAGARQGLHVPGGSREACPGGGLRALRRGAHRHLRWRRGRLGLLDVRLRVQRVGAADAANAARKRRPFEQGAALRLRRYAA